MLTHELYVFCERNRHLRIERNARGEILILPPVAPATSKQTVEIAAQFTAWARADGHGRAMLYCGFILPTGAVRGPAVSWVLQNRLDRLTKKQKREFPPLCPDFLIEVLAHDDPHARGKSKMREWIDNGVPLAWLIDPKRRSVWIYRPNREPEEIVDREVDGEAPVAGFRLDLDEIW